MTDLAGSYKFEKRDTGQTDFASQNMDVLKSIQNNPPFWLTPALSQVVEEVLNEQEGGRLQTLT
jgi:hypothetical protein